VRGLMQRGRSRRATSPGCIIAYCPENEEGGASMSPSRPELSCRVSDLVEVDLSSTIRLRNNLDRSAAAATQCVVDDQNQNCSDHRNKNAI
jgi:hypothetical protein